MNAPTVTIRPRSLANVLADIREAVDDLGAARLAVFNGDADAEDRATEAETRVDDLRDEFSERFLEATGLTWKQIEAAIQEAIL